MRKARSLGVAVLLLAISPVSPRAQERSREPGMMDRFVGAWRLKWLEEPDSDGRIRKADCAGLLVYTRDGHMSVQVMYRNPQSGGPSGSVQYAQGGYEASFGTYRI